jgi:hypothetical protein
MENWTNTSMPGQPTLHQLEEAKAALDRLIERDGADTSGNLDKYHTRISAAREDVARITAQLKKLGILQYTERERISAELDEAFPNAANGVVVVWNGKRFAKRMRPRSKSRSGRTVYTWDTWWDSLGDAVEVDPEQAAAAAELERALNEKYPNARSRDTVEHEGRKYVKRYAPEQMSSSGKTVRKWRTWWEPV